MSTETNKVWYENDMYTVQIIQDCLDENGRSRCRGYGIFNKETGIREATGLVFGECRWRADQFANMVKELDQREADLAAAEAGDPLAAVEDDEPDVTLQ